MIIRQKNQNRQIFLYVVLTLILICGVSVVSWLLFDNIQNKSYEEIKAMIVASIVSYLAWIQLAYRLILDIVLYVKRFKNIKNGAQIQVIETSSKYLPKETKKVSQNSLKQEFKKYIVEKKLGDNLIRITDKEIVVVYGKEFETKEEFYKSIAYTLSEIQEEIRKKENGI